MNLEVRKDDLAGVKIQGLLREHLAGMMSSSPIESVHALPLDALRQPNITVWSVWLGDDICGCGALKELTPSHGEVKSMRTRQAFLRRGVGQAALNKIMAEAASRNYNQLSLETGTGQAFEAAHALYLRNGFEVCGPFADYKPDPFSVFMTKRL